MIRTIWYDRLTWRFIVLKHWGVIVLNEQPSDVVSPRSVGFFEGVETLSGLIGRLRTEMRQGTQAQGYRNECLADARRAGVVTRRDSLQAGLNK